MEDIIAVIVVYFVIKGVFKLVDRIQGKQKEATNREQAKNQTMAASRNHTYVQPTAQTMAQTAPVQNKTVMSDEKSTEKREHSMMDYLSDKADKEQESQDKERHAAEAARVISDNGARAAERVIDGESIPMDRVKKRCGYCGADNMIPRNSHEPYTCYFCREML
ncbi:MAG: hypothetical protein RRX92_05560 [Lachnospiraceae bacterium]